MKRSNLSNISKTIKPTFSMGHKAKIWFIRENFIKFFEIIVSEWNEYCKENNIDPIDEVLGEMNKFREVIKTESHIGKKSIDWKLMMGYDVDIDELASRWLDRYICYDYK